MTVDVIIVGGGGSGLACAAAAAQRGLDVVVLEKRPAPGGTTGIAIGSFTASRTKWQREAGIDDDPAEHERDAGQFGPPEHQRLNNDSLRQFFLEHGADTLAWLEQLGLSFHGPHPEPPNRVPRMHNVVPNAKAYIAALQAELSRLGGRLICDADVQSLMRDDPEQPAAVTGVTYLRHGKTETLRARLAVVLAAGDYAASPELIGRHRGEEFTCIEGINAHATGDGHKLAEQAGAQLVNMQITYGPELRFVPPPREPFTQLLPASGSSMRVMGWLARRAPKWIIRRLIKRLLVTWQHPEDALFEDGAILLNQQGERFCNELQSPAREIAVARQTGKVGYVLLDQRLVRRYEAWPHFISTAPEIAYAYASDYLRLRPDIAVAGSLANVCQRRGLDPARVAETLRSYHAQLETGADPYGRRDGPADAAMDASWLLLGPLKAYFTTTEGGVAINRQFQALDALGRAIPRLYAVGQNGLGGMVLWGHGLHIAWAITSGRLLGEQLGTTSGTTQPNET
ncbi:MAG: FAD-dependent oxidoreductase [Planctomycetales bacterium]|nr:FAD-dependent oxidoreductase [Planctomycetales bacterium]